MNIQTKGSLKYNLKNRFHKRKIYELINSLSAKGVAILLVSSELEEVMGLADRAYLIKNGETINEIIPYKSSIDNVLFELFDAEKIINA